MVIMIVKRSGSVSIHHKQVLELEMHKLVDLAVANQTLVEITRDQIEKSVHVREDQIIKDLHQMLQKLLLLKRMFKNKLKKLLHD